MAKDKTKAEILLDYLKAYGEITSPEAFKYLGETRLSATIFELRHKHKLKIVMEKDGREHGVFKLVNHQLSNEKRMDVIGQNGNDGLHYGEAA